MKVKTIILIISMMGNNACQTQTNNPMETKNNPLICNPEDGICGIPDSTSSKKNELFSAENKIKLIYFTDPICSSCWAIEPQLRKLKLEYGKFIELEYRMGGLLPDWTYNSGGISKPSDVAHHWDEVSEYYDMPIDGDVWIEDPLSSSYPASIAFKAAQLQGKELGVVYLRTVREMVFLQKKNISKKEVLEDAARKVGLDLAKFKKDVEGNAKLLFEEDLQLARKNGVKGFPTILFVNSKGNQEKVYGSKPYASFEEVIQNLNSEATKQEYDKNWRSIFSAYHSLTAREFAELSGIPRSESPNKLNKLVQEGYLEKISTKNGDLWIRKLNE